MIQLVVLNNCVVICSTIMIAMSLHLVDKDNYIVIIHVSVIMYNLL
jgi:hypothetical protein